MDETPEIRRLAPQDIELISDIDRSEIMDVEYSVAAGRLIEREVNFDIPPWSSEGTGDHSAAGMIELWRPVVDRGAAFLGAFDGDDLLGLVIVDESFEPDLAWLAFLHVTREHRRRGVGSALWEAAIELAAAARSRSIYVSAAPSGSAVGFYLSRGCRLADLPHPELFAREPDDIHLVRPIAGAQSSATRLER